MNSRKSTAVRSKFGRQWSWDNNYSCSDKGKIWIGWVLGSVTVKVDQTHEQYIHYAVHNHKGDLLLFMVFTPLMTGGSCGMS